MVQEKQVNLHEQYQWEASPGEELKIPAIYISRLRFEIVVFTAKKDFTFRCAEYEFIKGAAWRFGNVIIDTSKLNPRGEVELHRLTYHPEITLVNAAFMVMPAPEEPIPGEADQL